jgi:hypothetical protein
METTNEYTEQESEVDVDDIICKGCAEILSEGRAFELGRRFPDHKSQ